MTFFGQTKEQFHFWHVLFSISILALNSQSGVWRTNREHSTGLGTTTLSTHVHTNTLSPLTVCSCHKLLASGCDHCTQGYCISNSNQWLYDLCFLDTTGAALSSAGPLCFFPVGGLQQFLSFHTFQLNFHVVSQGSLRALWGGAVCNKSLKRKKDHTSI